jgi:hypothetical protein
MTNAIERASELDRLYFENNPDETEYIREIIPGEFGSHVFTPEAGEPKHVRVAQLAPGVRTRKPILIYVESSLLYVIELRDPSLRRINAA